MEAVIEYSLPTAILGSLIGSMTLFGTLLYLRLLPGAPSGLGGWAVAFGLNTLRMVTYLAAPLLGPDVVIILAETLHAMAAVFLVAGICRFAGRRVSVRLIGFVSAGILGWVVMTTLLVPDFLLRTVPLYGLMGTALIGAGVVMWRFGRLQKLVECQVTGLATVLLGLHKLDFPFLRSVDLFIPIGFTLTQSLSMVVAIGLVVTALGSLRRQMQRGGEALIRRNREQAGMNSLLRLSQQDRPLADLLGEALDVILALPWFARSPGGVILLAGDGGRRMSEAAWRGLNEAQRAACRSVASGHCAAGLPPDALQPAHIRGIDGRIEDGGPGNEGEAHYCVPIVSEARMLGILVIGLAAGHSRHQGEIALLQGMAGVLAGLIARTQAQEALRSSEKRLLALVGAVSDVVTVVDSSGVIRYESPSVTQMLGYEQEELVGRQAFDLVHPDDAQRVASALLNGVSEDETPVPMVYRFRHKAGHWRYLESIARSMVDDPTLKGIVVNSRDVTERQAGEAALRETQRQAEAANRAKSEFLANMSHELRTPLNAIIGFSQAMLDGVFGPVGHRRYEEYIGHVHASGLHLLQIINDLLDVSRIEAGKLELIERRFDLAGLIATCLDFVSQNARQAGLTLNNHAGGRQVEIDGDERVLRQVLLNLLSNAVKFTPEGGAVDVSADLDDDGALVLTVRDTGIGIAPADIERVFEPFVQIQMSMQRDHAGTGLGLPLSRALVELHGGTLSLNSGRDAGTTAVVRLPATRVHAVAAPAAPAGVARAG